MNKKYLCLNSRDELYRMDITKIVYFEAEGNYTNFVLCNKLRGAVCMNLAHMQQVLSENLKESASIFVRVGKRYIINITYVYQIGVLRQKLVLTDGKVFAYQLNISKEALKKLKDIYVNSIGNHTQQTDMINNNEINK